METQTKMLLGWNKELWRDPQSEQVFRERVLEGSLTAAQAFELYSTDRLIAIEKHYQKIISGEISMPSTMMPHMRSGLELCQAEIKRRCS